MATPRFASGATAEPPPRSCPAASSTTSFHPRTIRMWPGCKTTLPGRGIDPRDNLTSSTTATEMSFYRSTPCRKVCDVAQICNPCHVRRGEYRRFAIGWALKPLWAQVFSTPAESNSAIQQIANLRHDTSSELRRRALSVWSVLTVQVLGLAACGQPFQLPTANHALFEKGGEERFFVGTAGKSWTSGTFGCVRSGGWQMHEGLDIRCLQRDTHGEPTDPVMATADGVVVYFSKRPSLSNYGNYVVLRHLSQGLEIYSLYAHLREIRRGLKIGQPIKAGETI